MLDKRRLRQPVAIPIESALVNKCKRFRNRLHIRLPFLSKTCLRNLNQRRLCLYRPDRLRLRLRTRFQAATSAPAPVKENPVDRIITSVFTSSQPAMTKAVPVADISAAGLAPSVAPAVKAEAPVMNLSAPMMGFARPDLPTAPQRKTMSSHPMRPT